MDTNEEWNKLLWQNMTKEELAKYYSPGEWSPRFKHDEIVKDHIETVTKLSAKAKKNVPCIVGVSYGPKPAMKLDIFGDEPKKAKSILVYVHGGYWHLLDREISSYAVEPAYKKGLITIIIGYTLAPKEKMVGIVNEIREGIMWVCNYAEEHGINSINLMGHSAGGHLITQALSSAKEEECPKLSKVTSIVNLSAVFDVRPLVNTVVNEPLNLTQDDAWELSPLQHISALAKKFPKLQIMNLVGDFDSPEFERQTIQFAKLAQKEGLNASYCVMLGKDHFNLVEELSEDNKEITKKVLQFICGGM